MREGALRCMCRGRGERWEVCDIKVCKYGIRGCTGEKKCILALCGTYMQGERREGSVRGEDESNNLEVCLQRERDPSCGKYIGIEVF